MGDERYKEPLVRLRDAEDRKATMDDMTFEDLVLALGAASRERDPYMANVLTSEILNRSRRGTARVFSAGLGVAAGIVLLFIGAALLSNHPHNFDDHIFLILTFVALTVGSIGAAAIHSPIRRIMFRRRV